MAVQGAGWAGAVVRRIVISGTAAIGSVVLLFIVVWLSPMLFVGELAQQLPADQRLQRLNEARVAVIATLATIGTLGTLLYSSRTYRLSLQALRLNEQGQLTERFSRAFEQLGSDSEAVKLGGVYALERIARESETDRQPIMEALAAYVRVRVPWPPKYPYQPDVDTRVEELPELQTWAPDVQAIMTVIGRRSALPNELEPDPDYFPSVELTHVDLRGVSLPYANLHRIKMNNSNLSRGWLRNADLRGADIRAVRFNGADLLHAIIDNDTTWRDDDFDPIERGVTVE